VLIVRGAGEKFFSAGADITMLASAAPRLKYYFCLHANETLMRLEQTPKLVIAALNGHTVGGGRARGRRPSGQAEGLVVLKKGHLASPALEDELKAFIKDKIAPYKYPCWVMCVPELPKTATGKIQRFKLRQIS
jgi:acyl-CoA synthetase (AMP-forming)/AMP-acid ligase II